MRSKNDDEIIQEMHNWFLNQLGCVVGRREFMLGRYEIKVINTTNPIAQSFDEFIRHLQQHEKVAGLLIFNNPRFYREQNRSVMETIQYIAEQVSPITNVCPFDLIRGHKMTTKVPLTCPVTNTSVTYYFYAVAFCPQSGEKNDPLYDKAAEAPYTCVNIISDVFAFSMFVRDEFRRKYQREVYDTNNINILKSHFSHCAELWQSLSKRTINNYKKLTAGSVCPVRMTADGSHWIAPHQDPVFAEITKDTYFHEMPIVYTKPIIDKWVNYFENGVPVDLSKVLNDGFLKNVIVAA